MSIVSVFSGLLLSVGEGVMAICCGSGGCVEVVGRIGVAAGWIVTSVLTTIFGAKALRRIDDPSWAIATIVLCWCMVVFSTVMGILTIVRSSLECGPARHWGHRHHLRGGGFLTLCAEVLCLAWLFNWFSRPRSAQDPGYTWYTPAPGGPGGYAPAAPVPHSRSARQSQSTMQYHEHLMHSHVPVNVVHPVGEPSNSGFFGHAQLPHAPPMHPSMQPQPHHGPAMGVPVQAPQAEYPEIFPPAQQQHQQQQHYPAPVPTGKGQEEPSAPPMPGPKY